MPIFIFALFVNLVRTVLEQLRNARESKPKPLCTDCFYAHMQYGSKAKRAISCTFGGGIRAVKLDVLYCTDYQARNVPSHVRIIGFERHIASTE